LGIGSGAPASSRRAVDLPTPVVSTTWSSIRPLSFFDALR
jgi:hypothetical protein